jgi:hypothetical protein
MKSSRYQPDVDDVAPDSPILTEYDKRHMALYLLLLDADAEGDNWQNVANIVLNIDPVREPRRAHRAWETHLARARWMRRTGHRYLPKTGVEY